MSYEELVNKYNIRNFRIFGAKKFDTNCLLDREIITDGKRTESKNNINIIDFKYIIILNNKSINPVECLILTEITTDMCKIIDGILETRVDLTYLSGGREIKYPISRTIRLSERELNDRHSIISRAVVPPDIKK